MVTMPIQLKRPAKSPKSGKNKLFDKNPIAKLRFSIRGAGGADHPSKDHPSKDERGESPSYGTSGHTKSPEVNGVVKPSDQQHCHTLVLAQTNEEGLDKRAVKKLVLASILCVCFMIGETIGGILANSIAIVSDAAHLLTDFTSFIISLLALHIASWPPSKKMTWGWHRAEVLGALISVLLIWIITVILVYQAVLRVIDQDFYIDAEVMVITAALGVAVNLIMGLTLHQDTQLHNHSHSHKKPDAEESIEESTESTESSGEKKELLSNNNNNSPNRVSSSAASLDDRAQQDCHRSIKHIRHNINVRAAFIHVLGDLINSIGVLTAALIIYFKPEYKIADPICTFLFSILVMVTTAQIVRDTLNVFLEATPKGMTFADVSETLSSVDGVKGLHNLRIWALTMSKVALSVHLAVDGGYNQEEVVTQASIKVRKIYGIYDITIQTETYVEEMEECVKCREPK